MVRARAPTKLSRNRGLKQITDTGAIEKLIDEVLAANAVMVAEFKAGKEKPSMPWSGRQ